MLHTQEWYELLKQFEKLNLGRIDRETKEFWPKHVYQDGRVNDLFQLYMSGYSFGKAIGQMNT
jgi:hypothetical protein